MLPNGVLLEDLRLATKPQLKCYTQLQRAALPSLPGFAFTQLLDLVDNHLLRTDAATLLVAATPGTVRWLNTHIENRARVEHVALDLSAVLPRLTLHPVVTYVLLLTANSAEHTHRAQQTFSNICRHANAAVYDPTRLLRDWPGKYFMNSSIWLPSAATR